MNRFYAPSQKFSVYVSSKAFPPPYNKAITVARQSWEKHLHSCFDPCIGISKFKMCNEASVRHKMCILQNHLYLFVFAFVLVSKLFVPACMRIPYLCCFVFVFVLYLYLYFFAFALFKLCCRLHGNFVT